MYKLCFYYLYSAFYKLWGNFVNVIKFLREARLFEQEMGKTFIAKTFLIIVRAPTVIRARDPLIPFERFHVQKSLTFSSFYIQALFLLILRIPLIH